MAHKFKVGQLVHFVPGKDSRAGGGQAYQIVKCLPRGDGQYQYRIKSKAETFERMARESELEFRR
jgi:hypothetical protein